MWGLLNGNDQFLVPQFQRNYAWTNETADILWTDLTDSFQFVKKSKSETQDAQYLLGPMVLVHDKENKYWVIDGQQRLSTITMLFCVARDIILENTNTQSGFKPEGYDRIMDMLENVDIARKHVSWKLVLNNTDRELFQQIQAYEDTPIPQVERIKKFKPRARSQKLLANNYVYLYDRMMEAIRTDFKLGSNTTSKLAKNKIQQNLGLLNQFLNHVMRNNFIVKIVVDDNGTAYQIFETLNYRGKTLSKSNLIKNYVLNKVKIENEQRDMSSAWNNIFDDIISQGEADDVFILESFRSRNYRGPAKKASRKNLYDVVRKKIKTEREAKVYIKSLRDDAEFLTTLYNPDSYQDRNTKDAAYAIKLLKAKSIRVPILAAYRRWYDERRRDYEQLVQFLVKFFFNLRIIRETHAGKIEQIMLEVVKMIEEGASVQSVILKLQEDYDHDDFKHNFNKFMSAPTSNTAKYVLHQITISLGTKDSDVRPIDALTLEHILPKSTDKWDRNEFFADYKKPGLKMDEFVGHLGNLTLLKDVVNKRLQNEPFSVKSNRKSKKTEYCSSDLEINKQTVCNHNKWTAKIIEDRANLLAERAYKIWDLAHQ